MTKTIDVSKINFDYQTLKPQLAQFNNDRNGNPGQYIVGLVEGCVFVCLHCRLQLAASVVGIHLNPLKPKCKNLSPSPQQEVTMRSFDLPAKRRAGRGGRVSHRHRPPLSSSEDLSDDDDDSIKSDLNDPRSSGSDDDSNDPSIAGKDSDDLVDSSSDSSDDDEQEVMTEKVSLSLSISSFVFRNIQIF